MTVKLDLGLFNGGTESRPDPFWKTATISIDPSLFCRLTSTEKIEFALTVILALAKSVIPKTLPSAPVFTTSRTLRTCPGRTFVDPNLHSIFNAPFAANAVVGENNPIANAVAMRFFIGEWGFSLIFADFSRLYQRQKYDTY
ncbi:MAG: hypothetical protein ACEQSC_01045 [Candidatus Nanopelagicaceae bacterium]